MIILLKNKDTLKVDDFFFKCSIGKKGKTYNKKEGDLKTPKGIFGIGRLFYRADKLKKPVTNLKVIKIRKNMGWCNDNNFPNKYNKLITVKKNIRYEKMFRHDRKYDLVIPINYNYYKPKINKGSAIFIHLTKDYKSTAGCIALKKNDFKILLRLISKKDKIKII